MVVGMAMALEATSNQDWGPVGHMTGNVNPSRTMGANTADLWAPADIGEVTLTFTPILTRYALVWMPVYNMFLWGQLPRLIGANLLLPSAALAVAPLVANIVYLLPLCLLFAKLLLTEPDKLHMNVLPLAMYDFDFLDATMQLKPRTIRKRGIDLGLPAVTTTIPMDGVVRTRHGNHVTMNEPNDPVMKRKLRHRRTWTPAAQTISASRVVQQTVGVSEITMWITIIGIAYASITTGVARVNAWMTKPATGETIASWVVKVRRARPKGQKEVMADAMCPGTAVN